MKNLNDPIGNRNLAVPQPTATPRTPIMMLGGASK